MSYKLSERHKQDKIRSKNIQVPTGRINYAKLANVFIIFALISFFTSWIFSFSSSEIIHKSFEIHSQHAKKLLGPIHISDANQSLRVKVKVSLSVGSWVDIYGELLNANQDYLFSFGQDLWHESGYDAEGYYWNEADNNYDMKVTLPKKGTYYLNVVSDSNSRLFTATVTVNKLVGSVIPHLIFGILTLLIGIGLYALEVYIASQTTNANHSNLTRHIRRKANQDKNNFKGLGGS